MTEDEVRRIVAIMSAADNHCHVCAGLLCRDLQKAYPEHVDLIEAEYERIHEFKIERTD